MKLSVSISDGIVKGGWVIEGYPEPLTEAQCEWISNAMNCHERYKLALEKIEDPRKIGHTEPDEYTKQGCLMNIAHEALKEPCTP